MAVNKRGWRQALAVSAALLLTVLVAIPMAGADAPVDYLPGTFGRLRVFGLTDDGWLLRFRVRSPQLTKKIGFINGFVSPDTALIGIDFRVQDGLLYGVGNGGGVYTIDTTTAQLTLANRLTEVLSGTSFGVDFNPAADRLRIVSDTGQNLRHNVNPGGTTIPDGVLTSTPPPATPVPVTGITGAAYTNNDLDTSSTVTTLFVINTALDQVVVQSPANNGLLAPTGFLGVDAQAMAGFDIYSVINNGVTTLNRAMAVLSVNGTSGLYHISLLTGKATLLGNIPLPVVDIAIPLNQ
jgi:hypothetical protein